MVNGSMDQDCINIRVLIDDAPRPLSDKAALCV